MAINSITGKVDQYFSHDQHRRLQELMERCRIARDNNQALSIHEQAILEALVNEELEAAIARSQSHLS